MKQYIFLSSIFLMTISTNAMLINRIQYLNQKLIPQHRTISFVPSKRYPDLLVEYPRNFTDQELKNSSHIKVNNKIISKDPIIIKFDNHSKEEEHFTNAYGNSCIAFLKDFSYLPLTKRLTALFTKHPIYWDTVRFAKKDKIMKIIQIMQQYDLSKEEIEKQLEDLIKKTQKE